MGAGGGAGRPQPAQPGRHRRAARLRQLPEEWHQPVLGDTLPSETETYRLIADVLATGDPARYRPTLAPTTHWSHWPESGTF
ncbi:DUF7003 family protein [Dactylosporangium sp. NBC_01737]|uniref:DUF7003 family protein n=1 Tax=Dactylosporangium sp. NBC_01737 TaxID=2975959 RepID=UPI003FA3AF53